MTTSERCCEGCWARRQLTLGMSVLVAAIGAGVFITRSLNSKLCQCIGSASTPSREKDGPAILLSFSATPIFTGEDFAKVFGVFSLRLMNDGY